MNKRRGWSSFRAAVDAVMSMRGPVALVAAAITAVGCGTKSGGPLAPSTPVNAPPIAAAPASLSTRAGFPVTLDGSKSSAPNGLPLTYQWTLDSKPGGSAATISSATAAIATLMPDVPGTYAVTLLVNDGASNSAPHVTTINATNPTRIDAAGGWAVFGDFYSPATFLSVDTTLVVPPQPPPSGTLFIWPGLQYTGLNILQPVLTWGPSCAPGNQPPAYSTWWIEGMFVGTNCQGGDIMTVAVGDQLHINMSVSGTTWTQTVTSGMTGQSVRYSVDMSGEPENWLYFAIEGYGQKPASDVLFQNTTFRVANPDPLICQVYEKGNPDEISTYQQSADLTQCTIPLITLRCSGNDCEDYHTSSLPPAPLRRVKLLGGGGM